MPRPTIVEISPTEQAQMLGEVRRGRYGYLLALHILLLCAAQRSPTSILLDEGVVLEFIQEKKRPAEVE